MHRFYAMKSTNLLKDVHAQSLIDRMVVVEDLVLAQSSVMTGNLCPYLHRRGASQGVAGVE
jgi:hypothetical protein